ncbi:ATP-dependent sacrificial sulfur transferase LarE, partial [Myxococcota bacterium]|nr:ATP-dependent sacrificial sulfur transferase LarE [Myxococcota bacterium]
MNTPPLSSQLQAKLNRLNKHLESCGALVVGFSGGTDSTLLLHCAHGVLRDRVMAATIDTPYIPRSELAEACTFAAKLGVRHHVLTLPIPNAIRDNPPDRCYRCKKILFDEIAGFAATMGARVADGSNADDQPSQRPGMRALTELNVCSPLREAGLTKEDIRTLSRHAQLPTAHKPANSCLMTRLPTGTLVQESVLSCIEQGEDAIRAMGF